MAGPKERQESRGNALYGSPELYGLPKDVIVLGAEEGLVVARVPFSVMERANVPTNPRHVDNLVRLMNEETKHREMGGQLIPSLIAQVNDPRAPKKGMLYLCDGFHRAEGHEKNGRKDLYSTITLDCDLEKMWDLRIVSATNHAEVSFPRIADWVQQAWLLTPWSEGVTVVQALALVSVPNLTGNRWGISPEEADSIKGWVKEKSSLWHKKPSSIYQHMLIAQKADPNLVARARGIPGRGTKEGVLTSAQVRAVANAFPGDYKNQNLLAELAEKQGLTEEITRSVAASMNQALESANPDEAIKGLLAIDWRPKKKEVIHTSSYKLASVEKRLVESSTTLNTLVDQLWDAEVNIAHLQHTLALRDGRLVVGFVQNTVSEDNQDKEPVKVTAPSQVLEMDHEIAELERKAGDVVEEKDVLKAKNGDEVAFGRIFEALHESIKRFISVRVEDGQTADELASEVFTKAWDKIKTYEPRGVPFRAWVFRIARNAVIDHYRTRKVVAPLDAAVRLSGDVSYEEREVQAYMESAPIRRLIILNLTPDQRNVLILTQVLMLGTEETAAVLEKQQGAVRALKMRGIQTIQKLIKQSEAQTKQITG